MNNKPQLGRQKQTKGWKKERICFETILEIGYVLGSNIDRIWVVI
jgi:hypothetical protein